MDNLLLSEMVVFARVVEARGFAPAARALGLTTSAVSRSVARLEAALGLKLLHRTTRAVSLTEDGAEVYPGCARLLQTARDVQSLAGRFASTPRGKLRVSAPPVFGELWLAPKLPGFFARWPEVEIELVLVDRVVDLVDEGFDLALRIVAPDALAPGLVARRLGEMGYVLVASPDYLQRRGRPATPAALASHACIWLGYGAFGERLQMQRDGEAPVDVQLTGPLTVNNSAAILATVEAGLGIGLVPDFAAAAGLRDGRLERLLADWRFAGGYATRGVHAVYAPTRHLPRKVRALIDHLAEGGTDAAAEAAMIRP